MSTSTTRALCSWIAVSAVLAAVVVAGGSPVAGQKQDGGTDDSFRFRSGVDLVNVTATVTDRNGRFVPGLRQEDFTIYEENQPQAITHFSAERVPVSLGIVLDTSGSMDGEKIDNALAAIQRFLGDLLDPSDEIFIYRFSSFPELLQDWTTNRTALSRAIRRVSAGGGTAMYDALVEAVPMAQTGEHRKKAIVLVSDGNDTDSDASLSEVKKLIRETEVMVYAIGIDGRAATTTFGLPGPLPQPPRVPPSRVPFPPSPIPGRRPPSRGGVVLPFQSSFQFPQQRRVVTASDPVNVGALREITDDSGGRTEIVRSGRDLDPATASIADELSRQYYLGYTSTTKKDGRWHAIRVVLKDSSLRIRARAGYIATP